MAVRGFLKNSQTAVRDDSINRINQDLDKKFEKMVDELIVTSQLRMTALHMDFGNARIDELTEERERRRTSVLAAYADMRAALSIVRNMLVERRADFDEWADPTEDDDVWEDDFHT